MLQTGPLMIGAVGDCRLEEMERNMAYINLDDPEVRYSHNYGESEVYIVGAEAERIDIVRCGECKHFVGEGMYCGQDIMTHFDHFYCYYGERRADDER